jgi:hypothetical protein
MSKVSNLRARLDAAEAEKREAEAARDDALREVVQLRGGELHELSDVELHTLGASSRSSILMAQRTCSLSYRRAAGGTRNQQPVGHSYRPSVSVPSLSRDVIHALTTKGRTLRSGVDLDTSMSYVFAERKRRAHDKRCVFLSPPPTHRCRPSHRVSQRLLLVHRRLQSSVRVFCAQTSPDKSATGRAGSSCGMPAGSEET